MKWLKSIKKIHAHLTKKNIPNQDQDEKPKKKRNHESWTPRGEKKLSKPKDK